MVNSTYLEKLRDPRWQKKRLEIMKRDDFTCVKCFDQETTLNVHHCYYEGNKSPWEYEDSSLVTICENCHKDETEISRDIKWLIIKSFGIHGIFSSQILDFGYDLQFCTLQDSPDVVAHALAVTLRDSELQKTMLDNYRLHLSKRRKKNG